jgi:hypothetical protein
MSVWMPLGPESELIVHSVGMQTSSHVWFLGRTYLWSVPGTLQRYVRRRECPCRRAYGRRCTEVSSVMCGDGQALPAGVTPDQRRARRMHPAGDAPGQRTAVGRPTGVQARLMALSRPNLKSRTAAELSRRATRVMSVALARRAARAAAAGPRAAGKGRQGPDSEE